MLTFSTYHTPSPRAADCRYPIGWPPILIDRKQGGVSQSREGQRVPKRLSEPGRGPGQLAWGHFLAIGKDGKVYAAEVLNWRFEVFAPSAPSGKMATYIPTRRMFWDRVAFFLSPHRKRAGSGQCVLRRFPRYRDYRDFCHDFRFADHSECGVSLQALSDPRRPLMESNGFGTMQEESLAPRRGSLHCWDADGLHCRKPEAVA